MLTEDQILRALLDNSSLKDGAVWPWNFGGVADALLKLQGAVPEEAALQGYITEECPEGYVAKESDFTCKGCAFYAGTPSCTNLPALCTSGRRNDCKTVIFIRKEDAK